MSLLLVSFSEDGRLGPAFLYASMPLLLALTSMLKLLYLFVNCPLTPDYRRKRASPPSATSTEPGISQSSVNV